MKDEFVVAICGNPNSGKTSVFNALTGSHQTVGNWPGVTVERKEGFFRVGGRKYTVVDLPGTYSLTANSLDERIARDFLLNGEPDVIVVVVDKTNMERNLYLVLELMEMEKNMVIDMNMADEAEKKGIKVDTVNMSKFINLPIVDTVATTKEGIDDLKKVIYELSSNPTKPRRLKYEDRFEKYVVKVENLLKDSSRMLNYPLRWIAIKLLEKDEYVSKLVDDETMMRVQKIIEELERNYGESSEIVTAEARYALIHGISKEFVKIIPTIGKRFNLTDRLDMIFTNRIIGLPIFFLIMWAVFQITYWFGGMFSDLIDEGFNQLRIFFSNVLSGAPVFLRSFIVDGVIGGVGSILVFLPNIFFLFLAISFLGDLGYMARAAFVMDRIMHLMGLHGKAFIPMLLGFGCNVPAVMATRTLESEKDRIMTALIIPLMSCSARLPIYVIFAGTFFKKNAGFVIFLMYLLGMILAVIVAFFFRRFLFKWEKSLFIMELPPFRMPSFRNTFGEAWMRSKMFLTKAGTVIFSAVVIIWIMASLPFGVEYGSENSFIGYVGKAIAPVFAPLGFGYWQVAVALIFGLVAKEIVVSTLGTLLGGAESLSMALPKFFTPASAVSFMVFVLLYVPCIATIAVIKKEVGTKWAWFTVMYLMILAYIVSFITYNVAKVFI